MSDKHDEKDHKKKGSHEGGGHGGGHGGGGSHEEHEGAPEWLISFADNVSLMMGFFVIMLAMNMNKPAAGGGKGDPGAKQTPEMMDLQIAIREGFNNPVDIHSTDPRDLPLIRRILERRGQSDPHDPGPQGDDHDLNSIRPTDYHQMSGAIPFEDGSAALTDASKSALADIADHMRGLRLILEIRGHASAAEAYQSGDRGMKLSFDRAMTTAKALAEAGLDWRQMKLIASGDNDRMKALAHDKPGQRRNQRTEIIVTNEAMPETPGNEADPTAPVH